MTWSSKTLEFLSALIYSFEHKLLFKIIRHRTLTDAQGKSHGMRLIKEHTPFSRKLLALRMLVFGEVRWRESCKHSFYIMRHIPDVCHRRAVINCVYNIAQSVKRRNLFWNIYMKYQLESVIWETFSPDFKIVGLAIMAVITLSLHDKNVRVHNTSWLA